MLFNDHSPLEGLHAFLGASKHHWVNYTDDKLVSVYTRAQAAQRGTELHLLAHDLVRLGVKLPKSRSTLNQYVNDAIGFKMQTEVVLYYSDNCFGTVDAIAFKNLFLRIHDYKSGVTIASMTQLFVYAAIFCLEYGFAPEDLAGIELRLYQLDDIQVCNPVPEDVRRIMDRIVSCDKIVEKLRIGG